jgi:uncharacterized protein YbjT (DUF2867 family)
MFVVAGVTGNTGKIVADTLLAAGRKVRVVVRNASKGEAWAAKGAEVALADLEDAAALTAALKGAEGAYLLIPPNMTSADFPAEQDRKTDAFVAALSKAGVGHVVFLSSVGAHLPSGTGPILGVRRAEPRLAAVQPNITFLRAGFFQENWGSSLGALGQGIFPVFYKADQPIEQVATADIGRVAAETLLRGPRGREVIELTGPRPRTPREIAAAVSAIAGKPLQLVEAPIEGLVPTFTSFGISPSVAGLFEEMTRTLNAGGLTFEGAPVRGVVETETVLAGMLAGAARAH